MASSGKYARIYALGVDKVAQVDTLLLKGTTASELAVIIQNDWGAMQDLSLSAVERQLRRYRRDIDVKVAARQEVALRDDKTLLAVTRQVEQIDVIEDMNSLIHTQKIRINRLLEHEASRELSEGLLSDVKYEMQQLISMYKLISTLQLETGLMRRAAKTVSGMFSYDDDTGRFEFEAKIEDHKALSQATAEVMQILEGTFTDITDESTTRQADAS
ncbi:MAG: hypothetical protein QQN63_01910 [Nitrosopumilus sp.]